MELLKNLTWTQYFILTGISLLAYYSFVLFRYFSPQVQQLLQGRPPVADLEQEFEQAGQVAAEVTAAEEPFVPVDDELFERAEELLSRIRAQINEASVGGWDPSMILSALRKEIQKYPELNIQAFRPGINYTIQTECDKLGSAMPAEREIERLWTS